MQFKGEYKDVLETRETMAREKMRHAVLCAFCHVAQTTGLKPMAVLGLAASAIGAIYKDVATAHICNDDCPCGWEPQTDRISRRSNAPLQWKRSSTPICDGSKWPARPRGGISVNLIRRSLAVFQKPCEQGLLFGQTVGGERVVLGAGIGSGLFCQIANIFTNGGDFLIQRGERGSIGHWNSLWAFSNSRAGPYGDFCARQEAAPHGEEYPADLRNTVKIHCCRYAACPGLRAIRDG